MTMRKDTSIMSTPNLGANKFTFTGDQTHITFFPQTPGPIVIGHEGSELIYEGPEGNFTFFGKDISRQESHLGTLLTVTLRRGIDGFNLTLTLLLPPIVGVTRDNPVTFETLAIKATSGMIPPRAGAQLTYVVVPLTGKAEDVILPL
jgi:hypothetical protein